jgi:hypothetical protein
MRPTTAAEVARQVSRARVVQLSDAEVHRIQRVYSSTPLEKQHRVLLDTGGSRKIAPIPWDQFDRSAYPEEALKLAAYANRALATGEYGAIGVFSRITSAMAAHGVPLDLVSAASRVVTDELRHADYASRMASLCAGKEVVMRVPKASFDGSPLSLLELDIYVLDLCAIGEALACALFQTCLSYPLDPVPRAFFGNLLRDEVHHARLGWYYLAWRAPQWTLAERQHVADFAAAAVMQMEPRFSRGREPSAPKAKKAARALGVLSTRAQLDAVIAVTNDEIVPALDSLGLGASHAWQLRERVG